MTTGKFTLVIRWPSGQSTLCGEMTDHQHGEICRILSPDHRAELTAIKGGGEAVAYLDIGAGGYVDLGTDQAIEALEKLPYGRHMLGIIGTYGADGWQPKAQSLGTDVEPVAYAAFADNGNVRVWSRGPGVIEMMAAQGCKAVPLYTHPPVVAEAEPVKLDVVGYASPGQIEVLRSVPLTGGMKVKGLPNDRYSEPLVLLSAAKSAVFQAVIRCEQKGAFKTCLECGYQDGHDPICQYHESKRAPARQTVTREDAEQFLAAYHAEVWAAAEDEDSRVAYDDAGRELAKAFLARFDDAACAPPASGAVPVSETWQERLKRMNPTIQEGKWPKRWVDEAKDDELRELRALLAKGVE